MEVRSWTGCVVCGGAEREAWVGEWREGARGGHLVDVGRIWRQLFKNESRDRLESVVHMRVSNSRRGFSGGIVYINISS